MSTSFLITGNLGYVGSVLVPWLRERFPDAKLTGYDTGWFTGAHTSAGRMPETLLDQQIYGDVRALTAAHLRGVDCVIHLAAVSNDPIGHQFEEATAAINCGATAALAKLAAESGVTHFVFASSCSVYGASSEGDIPEHGELNPLSAYAKSKVSAESEIAPLARPDFRVTALRFGTACGFSPRLRLDLVVNDFVAGAVASGMLTLLSAGTAWRPLIHVEDMARAIEWAGTRTGEPYVVVNVGSRPMTLKIVDLARLVAERIGGTQLLMPDKPAIDGRTYRVDFSRFARLAPNHQPQRTIEDTVDDLAARLRELDFRDPAYREGGLIRLNTLRRFMAAGALSSDLYWTDSRRHV